LLAPYPPQVGYACTPASDVTFTIAARLELERGVRDLGLWAAESDANFIWLRLGEEIDEAAVVAGLRERGVLVRAGGSLGRPGALRVTVGTDPENARFLAGLQALCHNLASA